MPLLGGRPELAVVGALMAGVLSFLLVERPFLLLRAWLEPRLFRQSGPAPSEPRLAEAATAES